MNGGKNPLVSIIINCYNSDEFLKETLESVINQSYQNWEVIFWDNQSTDRSAEYLKGYNEPRFKYFYAPQFAPLSTARNLAVEKASGKFLAFLDCDDVWIKDKLALQMPYFDDENIGLVYSDFDLIMQSDTRSAVYMFDGFKKMVCKPHGRQNVLKRLLKSNYIIFSTIVVRKAIYDLTGGFTNEFKHNEDYEILLKVSLASDAACIAEKATLYRIHGGNNSYQNMDISFQENRMILQSLPSKKEVKEAINRNEVRFLIHNLIHKKELKNIKTIFGSLAMCNALVQVLQFKFNRFFITRSQR